MTPTDLDLSRAARRKSTRSNNGGNCIEIAPGGPGTVAVHDSADPAGPKLAFTPGQWQAFTAALKGMSRRPPATAPALQGVRGGPAARKVPWVAGYVMPLRGVRH